MLADPSIAHYFSSTDMDRQHKMQKTFLTKLTGGPDNYVGRDLYTSHKHLKITNEDFDKSKSHLENAMYELNVERELVREMSLLFESGRSACVQDKTSSKVEIKKLKNI
jgi:hemoglobin